jgi:hypothetical protein
MCGWKVDGAASGKCPVKGCGISHVETVESAIGE